MQHATVLVVEDDSAMRKLIDYSLKRRGYTVLLAATGAEAIEIAQGYNGKIALALIDVLLSPGIHGPQLQQYLNKLNPEIRVMFMSGFPHIESINRGMADFISKPFTPKRLLAQVQAALAEPSEQTQ